MHCRTMSTLPRHVPSKLRTGEPTLSAVDVLVAKITPPFENGEVELLSTRATTPFGIATTEVIEALRSEAQTVSDRRFLYFYLAAPGYVGIYVAERMATEATGRQACPAGRLIGLTCLSTEFKPRAGNRLVCSASLVEMHSKA